MSKKVLHIITGLSDGGAEGVLTRLCLNSHQAKHVVVSLMDEGKYGAQLKMGGVPVHCLGMNPGKPSLFKFFKLIRLIRAEQPDVVQTWMYHADFLGGLAARLAGVRWVFWGVRRSTLEKDKASRLTILIARLCGYLSGFIPQNIICCAHNALEVHASIGYQRSKMRVIPNGYDLSRFKPDVAARQQLRNELGLDSNQFLSGMVGRYDPVKDHVNLLKALVLVKKEGLDVHCVLVGQGLTADNAVLVEEINALGLESNITLAGQKANIPAVMNALDLHILASSSEGFPNVLAEAMACGAPCVSTDVGDAREILDDSECTCPPRDSRALAGLIIKMVKEWQDNPQAWQARRVAVSQKIAAKYSLQTMVGAYEACWFNYELNKITTEK